MPVTTPLTTQATNLNTLGLPGGSGSLASPDTLVLLGGQTYGLGTRYGGRFTAGAYLDPDGLLGVEASYLFIAPQSTTQMVGTNGSPTSAFIGFPFANPNTGEAFQPVGGPGFAGGSFLTLTNQLQSAELNTLFRVIQTPNLMISGLLGGRFLYFKESLDYSLSQQGVAGSGNDGIYGATSDRFQTSNNFWGANLGLRGEYRMGGLFVNATGKCALGAVDQTADVSGSSIFISPVSSLSAPVGTYALATNSGHHTQTGFAVVPEINCNVGYDLTRNIRAYVGYTFLYIDNVARPGTLIDHSINPSQSPGLGGVAGPPIRSAGAGLLLHPHRLLGSGH